MKLIKKFQKGNQFDWTNAQVMPARPKPNEEATNYNNLLGDVSDRLWSLYQKNYANMTPVQRQTFYWANVPSDTTGHYVDENGKAYRIARKLPQPNSGSVKYIKNLFNKLSDEDLAGILTGDWSKISTFTKPLSAVDVVRAVPHFNSLRKLQLNKGGAIK